MFLMAPPSPSSVVARLAGVLALFVVSLAVPVAATSVQGAPPATRALWVTRTTLNSPDSIARMVASAEAAGFNTLLVQVRGRGDAYYAGGVEPRASELASRPGFDPLATTLTLAHAAGMQVHAWVAVNLVSSAYSLPGDRAHVVYRSPRWLLVPRARAAEMRRVDVRSPAYLGRLARWTRANSADVEGLYTSPLIPAAAAYTAEVIGSLVAAYPVDGVHLDYVRFPSDDFDFSPAALQQFKDAVRPALTSRERSAAEARERLDPLAYPNLFADRWSDFRRSRLTALVKRIRTAVQAARPSVMVSAAVVPDAQQAFTARLQDWRTWIDQSLIDVLCPMAYTTEAAVFEQQVAAARQLAAGLPVWAGIGAYRLTTAQTLTHIQAAGRLGTAGIILFSYDALVAPPHTAGSLTELGRAAFEEGPD